MLIRADDPLFEMNPSLIKQPTARPNTPLLLHKNVPGLPTSTLTFLRGLHLVIIIFTTDYLDLDERTSKAAASFGEVPGADYLHKIINSQK